MQKQYVLLFSLAFFFFSSASSQEYSWFNISSDLPKFTRDTTIINGGADTIIANISGLSFLDNEHGWICTSHPFDEEPSAVLETTDGGLTWIEHSAPYSAADIHMIDELNGYLGATNGFIYKTSDGAQSWTLHGLLSASLYDLGFPPRPAQEGFAGGKNGHMARITPDGVFPIDLGLAGNVYCIDFPSEERGYALLDCQMIIYYQDDEWHVEASYPFSSKNWLYFLNDTVGWCVGEMFLKTTVGIDWYRTDPEFIQTGAMMGVYFTDLNNGWATGTQGQIAYTHDGGNDWTMLEHSLTDAFLNGVYFTSTITGYIYGGEKTLLKYGQTNVTATTEHAKTGIWPNPSTGLFMICKRSLNDVRVNIFDISGRILPGDFDFNRVEDKLEVDLSFAPSGVYFLLISDGGQIIREKLIKQ